MEEKSEMLSGEPFATDSPIKEAPPAEYRKKDGTPFTAADLVTLNAGGYIECIEKRGDAEIETTIAGSFESLDNVPDELKKPGSPTIYFPGGDLEVALAKAKGQSIDVLRFVPEEDLRTYGRALQQYFLDNLDAVKLLEESAPKWVRETAIFLHQEQGSNPIFEGVSLMDFLKAAFDIENGLAVREGPFFDYVEQERRAYLSGVHEDRYVMQGPATNLFTKTNVKRNTKRNQDKRAKTDIQTTEVRDASAKSNVALVSLNMDPSNWASKVGNITVSSLQLFDIIGAQSKKTNSPRITMEISEYMKLRGLTRLQTAREQVQRDLNTLYNVSLDYRDNNGEYGTNGSIRLISAQFIRNGVFQATLSLELWEYMQSKAFPMYIPPQLYEINSHKNPHSYYLLRKICEHKNMNRGKANEDLIAVKTLLGAASGIPTVEEVRKLDRNTKERIIVPFERDMNELAPTLQWEYCHNKGKSLTRSELDGMDFTLFQTLMIRIKWVYYPEQSKKSDSATSQLS